MSRHLLALPGFRELWGANFILDLQDSTCVDLVLNSPPVYRLTIVACSMDERDVARAGAPTSFIVARVTMSLRLASTSARMLRVKLRLCIIMPVAQIDYRSEFGPI